MTSREQLMVRIPSPTFLSALDEELFFLGLRLVGSVRSYEGVGRFLEVRLDPAATEGDERDLAALFDRYGIRVEDDPTRPRTRGDGVLQGVFVELQSVIAPGWSVSVVGDSFVVVGPDSREFRDEVWRIARFVAYDQHVCIERGPGAEKEYVVSSTSQLELSFRIVIRALPGEVT